jgi:Flp pilus assembly protein CpaB
MQMQHLGKLTSTRGGAVLVGVVAAVIAAILLVVYITHYRSSVKSSVAVPSTVLVAKNLIVKGTTGAAIGTKVLYRPTAIPAEQIKAGALTDPGALAGTVAATDIFPGQQLTATDFTPTSTSAATTSVLQGNQRAVTITIDPLNGSLGLVQSGDHVDIYQQVTSGTPPANIVKLFRPDVTVLQAGDQGTTAAGASVVVLRVPSQDAADVLYAAQHTELWFVLRPATKASRTVAETASTKSMLDYSHTH